jgi:hypothetical protein
MQLHIDEAINIRPIFGEVDGVTEWKNPNTSRKLFIKTQSYNDFLDEDRLFLYGRRGTGKSAFLHMLNFEISKCCYDEYLSSIIINDEDIYSDLINLLRTIYLGDLSKEDTTLFSKYIWIWTLNVYAMLNFYRELCEKNKFLDLCNCDLIEIKNYLTICGLVDNNEVATGTYTISYVLNTIRNHIEISRRDAPHLTHHAIGMIHSILLSKDFTLATKQFSNISRKKNKKFLILIDAVERYNYETTSFYAILSGLIEAVKEFYDNRNENGIIAKLALQAEIFSKLELRNKDKINPYNMFIIWNYTELVSLIAKRHYLHFSHSENTNTKEKITNTGYSFNDLDDGYNAKKYINKFFPKKIITRYNGYMFDTLSYIIRHTHKKPRHIILLANVIWEYNRKHCKNLTPELQKEYIKKAVHSQLSPLISGTIDAYKGFCNSQKLTQLTIGILIKSKRYFYYYDLKNKIKNYENKFELSDNDIMNFFIEACIVGIKCSEKIVSISKTKQTVIYEAEFDYHSRNIHTPIIPKLNDRSTLVIHPMFYKYLDTADSKTVFIYPIPSTSEKNMSEI